MEEIKNEGQDDFPEIFEGNGKASNLAATTNDRLKKAVIELRSLGKVSENLNENIKSLNASSDRYSRKLIYLTWALLAFTVLVAVLTIVLIKDAKEGVSSQNNIALNSAFFTPTNISITGVIENNKPILVENHGRFTDAELDNYLGNFDTIESSYEKGLLSESDLCDSFSYYIESASKNTEVKQYILNQQKIDQGFFVSLSEMAEIVNKSKNINCQSSSGRAQNE